MRFRDHSLRSKPPETYNVVIQMTYTEIDQLFGYLDTLMPDWPWWSDEENGPVYRFMRLLEAEMGSRSKRKRNPGWISTTPSHAQQRRELQEQKDFAS